MLVFIDQSGTHHPQDASRFTTIVTACMEETEHEELSKCLFRLKHDIYGITDPSKKELHAKTMLSRNTFNRAAAGIKDAQKHVRFVNSIFEAYIAKSNITLFAVTMDRPAAVLDYPERKLPIQFHHLFQRVCAMMQDQDKRDKALLMFDRDIFGSDADLSLRVTSFLFTHPSGKQMASRIVDSAFFVGSSITPGVQIADLIAGCVRQYYEYDIQNLHYSTHDPYFLRLQHYHHIAKQKTKDYPNNRGEWNYGFYKLPRTKLGYYY